MATVVAGCWENTGKGPSAPGGDGDAGAGGGDDAGVLLSEVPLDRTSFAHGVASGDPFADSVLLWTRVTTTAATVKVAWAIATDPELRDVVARGEAETSGERDYTLKVVADRLEAGTTYYYAFFLSDEARSTIGRTRTLPNDSALARIAFTSCANFGNGYFHAYRQIAQRADLDVWIHLGDYIYEYAYEDYSDPSIPRTIDPPTECITLSDYRRRYASWRTDADLQEVHRQHPLVAVWDDHEVANNAWKDGAENHQPNEGDYQERKRAGIRAFLEWLPIRVEPSEQTPVIYRQFAFGKLFDLIMLDTRHLARDEQAGSDALGEGGTIDHGDASVWDDPTRTLLGNDQATWLTGALSDSKDRGTAWRLIGNQIIFSKVRDPRGDGMGILFSDFWDGYHPAQKQVLDHLKNNDIDNTVFLTGDIHTSWAFEVQEDPFTAPYDPAKSLAVEFVGPSVTSLGLENLTADQRALFGALIQNGNPHLKLLEFTRKGYVLVNVTPESVQGEWYWMDDIKTTTGFNQSLAKAFTVAAGAAQLVETTTPAPGKSDAPPLAPEEA